MNHARFPSEHQLARDAGPIRPRFVSRVGWAVASVAIVFGALACRSITAGETDCYRYVALELVWGTDRFTCSGFRVVKLQSACPKIKSVKVKVYNDTNKNGVPDPGETVYGEVHGQADPPSDSITTAGCSGDKSTEKGGTSWHAEVENENGGMTTHGGTF